MTYCPAYWTVGLGVAQGSTRNALCGACVGADCRPCSRVWTHTSLELNRVCLVWCRFQFSLPPLFSFLREISEVNKVCCVWYRFLFRLPSLLRFFTHSSQKRGDRKAFWPGVHVGLCLANLSTAKITSMTSMLMWICQSSSFEINVFLWSTGWTSDCWHYRMNVSFVSR